MYKFPGSGGVIGGAGALAATGGNSAWWIALGLIMVVIGIFTLHAAQRRHRITTSN